MPRAPAVDGRPDPRRRQRTKLPRQPDDLAAGRATEVGWLPTKLGRPRLLHPHVHLEADSSRRQRAHSDDRRLGRVAHIYHLHLVAHRRQRAEDVVVLGGHRLAVPDGRPLDRHAEPLRRQIVEKPADVFPELSDAKVRLDVSGAIVGETPSLSRRQICRTRQPSREAPGVSRSAQCHRCRRRAVGEGAVEGGGHNRHPFEKRPAGFGGNARVLHDRVDGGHYRRQERRQRPVVQRAVAPDAAVRAQRVGRPDHPDNVEGAQPVVKHRQHPLAEPGHPHIVGRVIVPNEEEAGPAVGGGWGGHHRRKRSHIPEGGRSGLGSKGPQHGQRCVCDAYDEVGPRVDGRLVLDHLGDGGCDHHSRFPAQAGQTRKPRRPGGRCGRGGRLGHRRVPLGQPRSHHLGHCLVASQPRIGRHHRPKAHADVIADGHHLYAPPAADRGQPGHPLQQPKVRPRPHDQHVVLLQEQPDRRVVRIRQRRRHLEQRRVDHAHPGAVEHGPVACVVVILPVQVVARRVEGQNIGLKPELDKSLHKLERPRVGTLELWDRDGWPNDQYPLPQLQLIVDVGRRVLLGLPVQGGHRLLQRTARQALAQHEEREQ
eukprot:scaffold329689_cov43-Tisochrysis_lutea.AAC.1